LWGNMRSGEACFEFMTHVDRFPLTTGIVVDRRGRHDLTPGAGLADLAVLANADRQACAYGKIAVIADDGIHAFQVMHDGRQSPAFCGNSTAAAIACMDLASDLLTRVHGPSSNAYSVSARASRDGVSQAWFLQQPVVEEIDWCDRKVLLVRALNDYAIVVGELPDSHCPEQARTQLLGQAGCGKLAVVETGVHAPMVRFFNTNGQHGAAPQTGLASIALAAMTVDWFGEAFADRRVGFMTRNGLRTVGLPVLRKAGMGLHELEIAPITVEVSPLASVIAA
jgi:hypothetical protein